MSNINHFTLRVYGMLINEQQEVLLSKERFKDVGFTKFPGGGLEFGEGTKDCLIREFKEEANIEVEVISHFYTTDFFQQSGFIPTDQLIAIYYLVQSNHCNQIRLDEFDIENNNRTEQQQFSWVPLTQLTPQLLTFPVDKWVTKLLIEKYVK